MIYYYVKNKDNYLKDNWNVLPEEYPELKLDKTEFQLKEYFKVLSREILDYMKILEKQDIIHILSKMGLEDKEIKTLLK